MDLTKQYNEKELTITVKGKIDTINAPDFENEIMDEMDEVSDMQEYAKERWRKRQKRYRKVTIPEKENDKIA